MIARGQFGHHSAKDPVQFHLAPEFMRQQSAPLVEHGNGAFIAGGLDCKDSHGVFKYDLRNRSPWSQ